MSRLHPNDYESLAAFRHLLRKFLRFSKDYLKSSAGVNPEQYEALLAIKAFNSGKALTIVDLSDRLQIKHHSAINLVNRLEARKLITRTANKTDRRERHLALTPKGSELLEKMASVHRKELRQRSAAMIKALEQIKN